MFSANILRSVVFGMSDPDAVMGYKRGLGEWIRHQISTIQANRGEDV